jgi:hypothetical protein
MLKRSCEPPNSWVMLSETEGFVRLPGERTLFTSPPRTTLSLQTPNTYPGAQPLSISSSAGFAFLTNQRVSPCESFARDIPANRKLLDSLPTRVSHSSSPILLSSYSQPPRHTRLSTLFWPKCLDRRPPTRHRRGHTTSSPNRGAEDGIQRRRSI